jgi:hypothetical protein
MKRELKIGFCIALVLLLFVAFALPISAFAAETMNFREFQGEAKVWEKVKPDSPPGKPPKPGDEDPIDEPDLTINKMAVVIGIADYRGRSSDLQYTDDDARDMYDYLTVTNNYPPQNVKLLLDKQATATKILDAIDWMAQYENSNTECVFFYSGHGGTYSGGIDLPYDPDGIDEGIISHDLYIILDDTLASKFASYDTGKLAIMFDSCHSGGMDDLAGPGRVVSAPCEADEYSYDGPSTMQNGVWTYFLMLGLETYHTVEQAHDYAAIEAVDWVSTYYHEDMTPVIVDGYTALPDGYWHFQ